MFCLKLLVLAGVVGLIFRALRIPFEYYAHERKCLVQIGSAIMWVSFVAAVVFMPWVVDSFIARMPSDLSIFVCAVPITIGYCLGVIPGCMLYKWLERQKTRKREEWLSRIVEP